jgi:hypothetical protein
MLCPLATRVATKRGLQMRMMMKVSIPVEAGNKSIKDGGLPRIVAGFVEQFKPESAYFTAEGGKRTAFFVFDLKDPTMIPSVAEPFFMSLGAEIELSPCMNVEDMKMGVEKAMKRA